jgi:hypothetical protein
LGLLPRSSAFGLVEIKRSNHSGVDDELEDFIEAAPNLVYERQEFDVQGHAMGVVSVLEQCFCRCLDIPVSGFHPKEDGQDSDSRA